MMMIRHIIFFNSEITGFRVQNNNYGRRIRRSKLYSLDKLESLLRNERYITLLNPPPQLEPSY